jgi:aconitate hydratase
VENLLRKLDGRVVREEDLKAVAAWQKSYDAPGGNSLSPRPGADAGFHRRSGGGGPGRHARCRQGPWAAIPARINPLVPVELIVDHSVQIDSFGTDKRPGKNVAKEYERNGERYKLLKWAQKSFDNFKVVPPNSGICHQVNLEHLGRVVIAEEADGRPWPIPTPWWAPTPTPP